MTRALLFLWPITAAFVVVRLFLPVRPLTKFSVLGIYEAFAHILFGVLIGTWWAMRENNLLAMAAALLVVEVVVFAVKGGFR